MEGKAGMAAIYDENGTLDVNKLTVDIKEQLPIYARPQFVRILTKIDLTGMHLSINSILITSGKQMLYSNCTCFNLIKLFKNYKIIV